MRTNYLLTTLLFLFFQLSIAQVGIGTTLPDPSSELDVSSPLNDKGILIPRMTQAQRNLIASPATSLLIYQTDNTPGFYYYNGTIWVGITAGASTDWTLLGNAGTTSATNFFGTTDDNDIVFKRFNVRAGFIGNPIAAPLTALNRRNTSFGANSLLNPAGGYRNTAIGSNIMTGNTSGNRNVAIGDAAMSSNTSGQQNVAIGVGALFTNQLGNSNVAIGRNALTATNGTTGTQASNNTAVGMISMELNTTGAYNSAFGRESLYNNSTGDYNVGIGWKAGFANTVGINNVSIGNSAGLASTGSNNITIGSFSEAPVLANSDQLSIGNVIYGTTMTSAANGKIGIGESNPNAKLQISSSNQATPTITDGIIIPKVDNLTAIPTVAQQGMLVYLTTPSGINQPGFYYWNNSPASWIGLLSSQNGDHDWYKVGTTTAPTTITDDMFHSGKVAIGKITASSTLDVETADDYEGIKNSTNKIGGSVLFDAIGINNTIDAQFSRRLGIQNNLNGSVGNTSNKIGVQNNISNDGDEKIGIQNNITTSVTSSTTTHKGVSNSIINSNNTSGTTVYGVENFINNNSLNGPSIGTYNTVTSSSTAGTGGNYGVFNTISGYKLGGKIGVENSITSDVEDSLYGVYNLITSTATDGNPLTNSNVIGMNNSITLNNDAIVSGNYNYVNGTGNGNTNGVFSSIANTGNGDHTGIRSILSGTGTGTKWGTFTTINTTAGGTHYGVYSEVLKAGATNFAGYFLGNVGIGTTNLNTYTLPASRAASAGQIMQSNATGVVTWQTPAAALNNYAWLTTGNTSVATDFIGTNNAFPLRFVTSGTERMRIIQTTGEVVVGATVPFAGDKFSSYAVGNTQFAVNGYSTLGGVGVFGDNTGAGIGVYGNNSATGVGVEGDSTGAGVGVFGFNSGATGISVFANNTGGGNGVQGQSTLTGRGVIGFNSGTGVGVQGQSTTTGTGVFGFNNGGGIAVLGNNTSTGNGVQGQTSSGTGAGVFGIANVANGAGTYGTSNGANSFGVFGANTNASGTGVLGLSTSTIGSTRGVRGQSASNTGFGALAQNTSVTGTGLAVNGNNNATLNFLANGSGAAINGTGVGTVSYGTTAASGIGLIGVGNNQTGSAFAPSSGAGTVGIGNQFGVMGFALTTVNTNPGNPSVTNGVNASSGGYFEVLNGGVAQTWSYVGVRDNFGANRKIIGNGTVNTIVKDLEGKLVALSAPEAPENLFQDYGRGELIDGKAHITIDPIFSKNIAVNDRHPLRVFVQLEGDCEGVFVTNKSQTGFDVTELKGGRSNVPFTYTIVANRADEVNPDGSHAKYSEERFSPAPGPIVKTSLETKTQLVNENIEPKKEIVTTTKIEKEKEMTSNSKLKRK